MTEIRILALMMRLGDGHISPCIALARDAAERPHDRTVVQIYDTFHDAGFDRLDRSVRRIWITLAKHSRLHHVFYRATNNRLCQDLIRLFLTFPARQFAKRIAHLRPHAIFCSNPLSLAVLDRSRDFAEVAPVFVYNTDIFDDHQRWRSQKDCFYLSPNPVSQSEQQPRRSEVRFLNRHKPRPQQRQFNAEPSDEKLTKKLRKVVILAGGEGIGISMELIRHCVFEQDFDIDVICGRNTKILRELSIYNCDSESRKIRIYGYLDDISENIDSADLVISKSGVNTIMECLHMHTPMILTECLSNEYGAYKFVVENGFGWGVGNAEACIDCVRELAGNVDRLRDAQLAIQSSFEGMTTRPHALDLILSNAVACLPSWSRSDHFDAKRVVSKELKVSCPFEQT